MKRKTITALLIIAMIMGISAPAYAEDTPNDAEPPQTQEQPQPQEPQEETSVVVSTLDELQAAVAAAEDGDTIQIAATITLNANILETEKEITLTNAESYTGDLFRMGNGAKVSGFRFLASASRVIVGSGSEGVTTEITNCQFVGDAETTQTIIDIYGGFTSDNLFLVSGCSFSGATNSAICIKPNVTLTVQNCSFANNRTNIQGGAISNAGIVVVEGCSIVDNYATAGGGLFNSGTMTISDCLISGNATENEKFGSDIFSVGTLTISDAQKDGEGYYEETTGQKVPLPLTASTDTAKLVYLIDEQAAEYFAPEVGDEPEDEDTDTDTDEPTDPDTTPDTEPTNPDTPPDDPEDGGEDDDIPEQQPTQPPEDDDGGEDTPEQPTQPEEPEDDDNSDNDTNTPVEPSEPPQEDDDSEDDYSPPIYIRPPHRPSVPAVPDPDPEEEVEPELTPTLVCGKAAIDMSRSVVLQGYGDSDLHLEDSLTRAQLATIICRLLDDESIAAFSIDNRQHFADVPADMWCYEYVQIIAKAGIVYGVGGGNYDPNGTVTWAQVLTVLSRFVEPQEYNLQNIDYDGWALQSVQTAAAFGWIEDSTDFSPDDIISRGALVQLVNGILENYRNISEE
ncbi:MAG: S-layer homology domain-containing protein [Phoenicibacter congonensis]|uniref:S-layer homology domain-containing protein n=1 Tax=Phoenicibacter congonensis TaxID=1944646 RepID=A0AA43RIK8_9ACTN|nr:S-layer homology domain-containing protein [Phoenicibacter congonensis]